MIGNPRFVLDTNILVDTICFRNSFGRQAYDLAVGTGVVVMSQAGFAELEAVMKRPKFDRFLEFSEREAALDAIRQTITFAEPWCHYQVCRDPSDDKFIDLAVCVGAASIITRDADLLTLNPINGIPIIDARSFVLERSPNN